MQVATFTGDESLGHNHYFGDEQTVSVRFKFERCNKAVDDMVRNQCSPNEHVVGMNGNSGHSNRDCSMISSDRYHGVSKGTKEHMCAQLVTACIARPNGTRLILEHKSRIISEHKNWLKSEHENRIISENTDKQKHRQEPPLYGNLQEKCYGPEPRTMLCASLRSRNALQHVTRAALYGNLQEKCRAPESAQNTNTHFVQACAIEMHLNISQEPLYTEIYRKNAGAQSGHPDQAPAFAPTVRTPQCGHTVWGKKETKTLRNQKPGNQETTTPGN